jgi:PAS domain-containing protein
MLAPIKLDDESNPVHALRSLDGNTLPDERFDGLTRLARRHFGVTLALIMRVDGQRRWFSSCDGLAAGRAFAQTPRALSFCGQAIPDDETRDDDLLVIPDTLADNRVQDHPLVADNPCIRFYAGCPLRNSNGETLGAFCLLDTAPHDLDHAERECLRDFARLAEAILARDQSAAHLKEDQDALRKREKRMALAIAGSGTGIWDRNIVTNEIHYSAGWKAILGYADWELTNQLNDSYQRVHPDDLAYVQAAIQAHSIRRRQAMK